METALAERPSIGSGIITRIVPESIIVVLRRALREIATAHSRRVLAADVGQLALADEACQVVGAVSRYRRSFFERERTGGIGPQSGLELCGQYLHRGRELFRAMSTEQVCTNPPLGYEIAGLGHMNGVRRPWGDVPFS
jgi:hypothetical protein